MSGAQQQEVAFPEYVPSDLASMRPERVSKTVKEGWFRMKVLSVSQTTTKNGHYGFRQEIGICDEDGTPQGPRIYNNLLLPKANTEVPEHVAPNTFGIWGSYFRSTRGGEFNAGLSKNKATGAWVDRETEETLTQEEATARFDEVDARTAQAINDVHQDPEQLLDDEFYGLVVQNGKWTNLKYTRSLDQEPEEVIYEDFFAPAA